MKLKKVSCITILLILCLFCLSGCNTGSNADVAETEVLDLQPEPFVWTDEPELEMIPDKWLVGEANGVEFVVGSVFFEPRFGKWRLVIAEEELDSPTAVLPGGQSINIDLPETPKSGSIFIKEMEYGNGFFQIKKQGIEDTTSWNADNAYAIEITKWEVQDYDPLKERFQSAGKASGRVYIVYSGENWEDFENSGAFGIFEDVPVRYMGEPDF